jgi:MipA family protein
VPPEHLTDLLLRAAVQQAMASTFNVLKRLSLGLLVALVAGSWNRLPAQDAEWGATVTEPEIKSSARPWGVGFGLRVSNIPFSGETAGEDSTVADLVPLFYYEGRRFFLRGLEGGVRLWSEETRAVNLVGRYRFFDFPAAYQNEVRRDALDAGLQWHWQRPDGSNLRLDLLSDPDGRAHVSARWGFSPFEWGAWRMTPEIEIRAKTSDFNSYYYGLDVADVGAGVDVRGRLRAQRHLVHKLHLIASVEASALDSAARRSPVVDQDWEWAAFLGLGIFGPLSPERAVVEREPYWRLAQGWGTASRLGEILIGERRTAPADVRMTSLFYGRPVAQNLLTWPLDVYLTGGLAHHYRSDAQGAATEYILALKLFYTPPWPWRVRLGVAEGLSYKDSITYYERASLTRNQYRPSNLLNYLDVSVDVNIGDVIRSPSMESLWFGSGIHHRSGIFETSSLFGRIKGGSNFVTLYLQWSP